MPASICVMARLSRSYSRFWEAFSSATLLAPQSAMNLARPM